MSHDVLEASNRILGFLKRRPSGLKCTSKGQPSTDSRLSRNVVADQDRKRRRRERDVGKGERSFVCSADRLKPSLIGPTEDRYHSDRSRAALKTPGKQRNRLEEVWFCGGEFPLPDASFPLPVWPLRPRDVRISRNSVSSSKSAVVVALGYDAVDRYR